MPAKNRYTPAETLALIDKAQRAIPGDDDAIEKLLQANIGLSVKVARDYARHRPDSYEDYLQCGQMGFISAVKHFDVQKGHVLSTFAMYYIRQSIQRYAGQDTLIRAPVHATQWQHTIRRAMVTLTNDLQEATPDRIAAMTGISEEHQQWASTASRRPVYLSTIAQQEQDTGQAQHAMVSLTMAPIVIEGDSEEADYVQIALRQLTDRERYVLQLRYLNADPMTLEAAASVIGNTFAAEGVISRISRERVRQIEQHAIAHLRQILGNTRKAMHDQMDEDADAYTQHRA